MDFLFYFDSIVDIGHTINRKRRRVNRCSKKRLHSIILAQIFYKEGG